MNKNFFGLFCILIIISITVISWKPQDPIKSFYDSANPVQPKELLAKCIDNVYETAHLQDSGLNFNLFKKAYTGFINLKATNKLASSTAVITIIDYTMSSQDKRMWVIDLTNKNLILHLMVAHGECSGFDIPDRFSDRMDSKESSLGFYITDNVYYGRNGRSLKLDGMDAGFNTNARARAIVVHGANYVCQKVIEVHGRLGRSYGCPAVSLDVIDQLIDTIKDKTVLFINGNSDRYWSKYLDEDMAANNIAADNSINITASL